MISKYFTYHHDFDDIVKNDPVKQTAGWWSLKSHTKVPWSWNTNIFTCDEIERIIVIGKRLLPKRAVIASGENLNYRRSYISWINPNSETEWIFRKITDLVNENNDRYWNYDLDNIETLQFTQYLSEENGSYSAHLDIPSTNNSSERKLSMSLQLSDPSKYEGGDLLLHISSEPTVLPKEKGMVSHTLHEVTPVTKGERYSLVAWIHGPNLR
jgi:PKHD-type hydroxylase